MQLAADEREAGAWTRMSHLLALLAEAHRDRQKRARPYVPWDFWHRPGERRPLSGAALTPEALRAIGPAIAPGNLASTNSAPGGNS